MSWIKESIMGAGDWIKRPENIFVLIASLFGAIVLFMIPPGWNSDEYQHFYRVEQLTDGKLFSINDQGERGGPSGGYLNRGVVEFMGRYGFENEEARNNASTPLQILSNRDMRTAKDDVVYVTFNGSAVYPPLTYAPQVVGNALGRALGLPVYGSFLLAKIFGFILFIIVMFWAIRLLPKGKWILLAISILGTTLVQATALGADAVTFSVVAFFISYTLYLAARKDGLRTGSIVALGVLMSSVGLVKPTYIAIIPIVGLLFINKKNRSRSVLIKVAISVVVAIAVSLLWIKLTSYVGTNGGPDSDRHLQLQHIMSNPFEFLATIARTYFGIVPGGYWNKFYEVAFTNYVWDSVRISSGFAFLAFLGIVVSLGIRDRAKTTVRAKREGIISGIIMIGTAVATFLLINIALYIYFTPVGQNVVVGVQARYIFPFLILLLLPLQNFYNNQRFAKLTMISALGLSLAASLLAIYKMIYVI